MAGPRWLIVGAGGFGRELARLIEDAARPDDPPVGGFLDANPSVLNGHRDDFAVLADPGDYLPQPEDRFLVAIGEPALKRRLVESLEGRGARFDSWVHPTAVVSSSARLERGVILYPYATAMNQAGLGPFAHLSLYASAAHDAQIGAWSTLSPYATVNGGAELGEEVFLGTHTSVKPGCRVGARSRVSSNSSVMHDAEADTLVFGVPGRHTKIPGR